VSEFGLYLIGTELTTGRRQDRHLAQVIALLGARGLELSWCCMLADDPPLITRHLRNSLAHGDVVFCLGGIGATPDDHTRQCAAQAAGLALVRHPGALAEIEARFGASAYPNRVRMADLPDGCELIPNPINRIPGFSLADHHFLPGFPEMAWPMLEWLLETRYRERFRRDPRTRRTLMVAGAYESELLELMEELVARFPAVRFASLPTLRAAGPLIELSLDGAQAEVQAAGDWLVHALSERGLRPQPLDPAASQ
jgi:molybdopterin-biosynthesis enzyme MoeA-like protein